MSEIILLAIDDREIQETLAPLLEAEGFTVIVETDGHWALRVFEKRAVGLVVLGAVGGQRGGLELAGRIRSTHKGKRIPLVMISTQGRKASIIEAARRAYDLAAVIQAPLRPERVLAELREVLGERYPSGRKPAPGAQAPPGQFADPDSEREKTEVEKHSGLFAKAPRRGSLAETPFPELLGQLYRERAQGAMLLTRGRIKKLVHFSEGVPTVIKSNRLEECLGRFLVRARLISQDECTASLKKMKASGRQQGTVLVSMGLISPSSLRRALELQLQMKLFDPFGWEEGSYRFDPKIAPPQATVPLTLSAATAIYRGIARKLDADRLAPRLADIMDRAPVPADDPLLRFQPLALSEPERRLLELLEAGPDLQRVIDENTDDRTGLLQLAYALRCTGMFTFERPVPKHHELLMDDEPTTDAASLGADPAALGGTAAPAAPGPELTSVRRALADELSRAREVDYFQLLEVDRRASKNQIREAFRLLARRFHPDHSTSVGSATVRHLNAELFSLICKAHEVLTDDALRAAYEEQLDSGAALPPPPSLVGKKPQSAQAAEPEPEPEPEPKAESKPRPKATPKPEPVAAPKPEPKAASKPEPEAALEPEDDGEPSPADLALRAEALFGQAKAAMNRKAYRDAKALLEKITKLCPDEAEYRAELGLAMFRAEPENTSVVRVARDELNQAVTLSPMLDRPHLYLGWIYRQMGQHAMSVHEFEQALMCNPKCTDAVRELRLLRNRAKPKKKGLGGLLGKWKKN